jgi:hypothetical protein
MTLKVTPEMAKALNKPLPKEAIKPHPTKTYLSTIKAIYVVERLNEVFGIGQWEIHGEKILESTEKMIVLEAVLNIPEYGITLRAYGGNDNVDRGDAYKGAVTDALTKIGSYLGIGMDVFKGLGDKGERHEEPQKPATPSDKQLEQYHAFVNDIKDAKTLDDLKNIYKGASESVKVNMILKEQLTQIKDLCTAKKEELNRG